MRAETLEMPVAMAMVTRWRQECCAMSGREGESAGGLLVAAEPAVLEVTQRK